MHTALAILAHALRMLIFETTTTLRVIMPALVLVLGSAVVAIAFAADTITLLQSSPEDILAPNPNDLLILLIFGIMGLLGYALMAVLWHRHVLMNGTDGAVKLFPEGSVFLGYVGRAILVGLVQMLASIPIMIAMGVLELALAPALGPVSLVFIGVLGGIAFIWVALRVSLALPAAALGNPLTLRESWTMTAPVSSALWGVALLLAGLNMFVFAVSSALLPDQGYLSLIVHTVLYIIEGLVFVSVLTTLYGQIVEGRSLG